MPKGLEDLNMRMALQQFEVSDDFVGFNTGLWSTVAADSGASVGKDATTPFGGAARLVTGGTNNNEAYLFTGPSFAFSPGKPVRAIGVVTITEANTDDSAWYFGLMSGVAADTIVDGGLTFRASSYGAFIWKAKDSNFLRCATLINGTLTSTLTEIVSTGRNTLEILITPTGGNLADVAFSVDQDGGQHSQPVIDSRKITVNQSVNFGGSPTALSLSAGIKAGGANSEILIVDYAGAVQRRGL